MLVLVHFDDGVQPLFQSIAVRSKTNDGEDNTRIFILRTLTSDLEELGCIAGVDAIAGGRTGVASKNGEVCTGDAKGRATVVGIAEVRVREVSL